MSAPTSPPLFETKNQFNFTCGCLNVHIVCHLEPSTSIPATANDVDTSSSSSKYVYLGEKSEYVKQPGYVTWDHDQIRSGRRKSTIPNDDEEDEKPPGESWRKCWICNVRVYKAQGKRRDDPPLTSGWASIDLAGGLIWGDKLNNLFDSEDLLPYSSLNLPIPSGISSFGKPPHAAPPPVYPRLPSPQPIHYIPPVPDPFFLPPPFIPSHPHLRNLCNEAVDKLRELHDRMEDQVREFIVIKSREMRDLEDKVRNEVETLWAKYESIPGVKGLERSRSRSIQRDEEKERRKEAAGKFSTPTSKDSGSKSSKQSGSSRRSSTDKPSTPVANPIIASAQTVTSPPTFGASSLLSASISANSFHAPPPPPKMADKVDNSIETLSKTLDKRSDARAVAMSHVFSVLDDAMANQASQRRRESSTRQKEQAEPVQDDQEGSHADDNEKDSWIDAERRLLASKGDEEDGNGKTPKAFKTKSLAEGKGKRAVKFQDPAPDVDGDEQADVAGQDGDDDEYVFDFELDDSKKGSGSDSPPKRDISRSRNMVEANLSKTFAADAPSHRAAWRVIEESSSIYASLRRTSTDSLGTYSDESAISKLAMSMPMNIAMVRPKKAKAELPEMERKTSLSEREGFLVPPLIGAMRQRGLGPNALGLSPSRPSQEDGVRRSSRSASVSRDREQARSYAADPGAVFESMADEVIDGDEDDDGAGEGTLRESGFIPPHVLAGRRGSKEGNSESGWRSLAPK